MHQKLLDVRHMAMPESIDRGALARLLSQMVVRQLNAAHSGSALEAEARGATSHSDPRLSSST